MTFRLRLAQLGTYLLLAGFACVPPAVNAQGQEALIKKNLVQRMPELRGIDEVTKTPMPGLFEVRMGADILYSDAEGNFLIQGKLYDVRAKRDLTEERMEKLLAISFDSLPLKDAFTMVRGNGKRKIAVFQDPNCPYCKRFERDLAAVDNVTVYLFLYPILSADSTEKSRGVWCSKDRAKTWSDWMLRDRPIPAATCDLAPINRNVEFGRKHRITGTPTLVFVDGTRVPGAIPQEQIEKYLTAATK